MKKTLLTLGVVALLASPSLFATEDSIQEHLQMEQKLQEQYQKRLKDGSGEENQYKHQHQHRNNMNNTIGSGMDSMRSMGGSKSGGKR